MSQLINLINKRYGRLIVISLVGRRSLKTIWLCRCDCGNLKEIEGHHLKCGDTKSCGCLHRERTTTHGLSKTKIYYIWYGIHQRCYNPKHSAFKYYGARGLTVCKRWHKLENFVKDMGHKPYKKSVERIDNNKGYSPGNCKWATHKEQMNNTRRNKNVFRPN